jgi:hypothetical protein
MEPFLVSLLTDLLSVDNTTRNAAEEHLNNIEFPVKLLHLTTVIRNQDTPADVKDLAAVLLRRSVLQHADDLPQLDKGMLSACRVELLQSVQLETNAPIRRRICDTISEFARAAVDDDDINHWPELLTYLFDWCNVDKPELFECALQIMRVVPIIFILQIDALIDVIQHVLFQALVCPNVAVSEGAVTAINAFVMYLDSLVIRQRLGELLPYMINILERNVELQGEETVFKSFIDVAEHCPRFFKPQLGKTFDAMVKVNEHT